MQVAGEIAARQINYFLSLTKRFIPGKWAMRASEVALWGSAAVLRLCVSRAEAAALGTDFLHKLTSALHPNKPPTLLL